MAYLFLFASLLFFTSLSHNIYAGDEVSYFVSEYDSRREVRTLTAHKIDPLTQLQIREDIIIHRESFKTCMAEAVFQAIHNGKKILQFPIDSNHIVTLPCVGKGQLMIHVGAFRILSPSAGRDFFFNYRRRHIEMTILE